jgi:hypothetical protein
MQTASKPYVQHATVQLYIPVEGCDAEAVFNALADAVNSIVQQHCGPIVDCTYSMHICDSEGNATY